MASRVQVGGVAQDHYLGEALERARVVEAGELPLHAFLALGPDTGTGEASSLSGIDGSDGTATRGGASVSLAGVPVAVKDNLCTLGLPTTCASRILDGYVSPFEATVVRRLKRAGGLVLGKTNMDEFAMGSSTENSGFGPTRNPRDRSRVPGGSSGGSAAAVAAGVVPCALGSDTGGSVRQPASFCGIVGIKPTYGRVSRYGLVAFASSLDQVGALGATVDDAALLLHAIAGYDPRDATSAPRDVPDWTRAEEATVEGLRIGVPREYFTDALDPQVKRVCLDALDRLRDGGARVEEVSLPHTRYAVPTYYVLAPAEASSNLARYDGVRYGFRFDGADSARAVYEESRTRGFGKEVVRRIMLGTFALSAGYYDAYYGRAQKVRTLIAQDFHRVWDDGVDLLFTPTAPTPAFPIGERTEDPMAMYLSDIFTVTANLAGIPGISLPIGAVDNLPVGGQLLAPMWEEARMIGAARALESLLAGGEGGR
ncbi:MAG: Asp-tRNA(Asn)/Glu-tRNA(Gln) amidotransferase subunit GatA [Gemmatimonadetes bacterium]|nr:Asp-tRNA(Asn)/Glu-tRNA(Gln) amidotransferase subunit GatA [Gemmatimonadota bacterium]